MDSLFLEMCASLKPKWVDSHQATGFSINMGWGRLFGGQLLAQSLAVAQELEERQGRVHSMHAHFLDAGAVDDDVVYTAYPMRLGRTYQTYRVEGHQNGRFLFHIVISFQIQEEGLSYQKNMPEVPQPESLVPYQSTLRRLIESYPRERRAQISKVWMERLYKKAPVEVRPIRPSNFLIPDSAQPERLLWFRASQHLDNNVDMHERVLSWISDFPMLGTALQPHSIPPVSPKIKMASLDHSIWFYAPFRADEWLFCRIYSPISSSGRGLSRAEIYRRDGVLVACCTQEGMLRIRTSLKERS